MNMQKLMAEAQKMQKEIGKKKEEIDAKLFPGKYEWVDVVFNGKREMVSITIKKDASLDIEDLEMLEDMIKLAVKDSLTKIDKEIKEKMGSMGSLNGLL